MAGAGDEYYYGGTSPRGAPHGLLLLVVVVVGLVVAGALFLGDDGEALTEAVVELLSPVGLLLLPVCLFFLIRLFSSDRGAAVLADVFAYGGSPDNIHRVGGSPISVAFMLLLILALLYNRSSPFGSDGEISGERGSRDVYWGQSGGGYGEGRQHARGASAGPTVKRQS